MTARRVTAKANMSNSQLLYKADYDKKEMPGKDLHTGQCIFFDRAPNTSQTTAEKLTGAPFSFSTLLPKTIGPFFVEKVGIHTLNTEQNCVDNAITTNSSAFFNKTDLRYLAAHFAFRFGEFKRKKQWRNIFG